MARPKKVKDEAVQSGEKSNVIQAPDSVMESLEKSLMADYKEYMNGTIPDRTKDIFKLHIPSLNWALSGGLPRGQMVHLFGPEGAGKTTLALHIVADVQKQGGRVMYLDLENSLDTKYAQHIGVNPSTLRYVPKPPSGEIALDMIEAGIRGGIYSLIVVDSVAAMVPAAVLECKNEQLFVAAQARMLSQALLKLNNAAVNSDAIILWVNQERANIAPGPHAPTTTPGGYALRFYSNVAMRIQRTASVKEGEAIIGQQVKVSVKKNKIGPPMREAACYLIYGEGIRRDWDLVIAAQAKGIIKKKGSWITYKEEQLGQGLKAAVQYAIDHPEFLDEIEKQIYNPEQLEASVSAIAPEETAPAAESAEE